MNLENSTREKQITTTGVIGIAVNILLSIFKAAVGLISGSIAIILDSVNNLTDAISSVITIIGIKLAKREPDKEHPFGHGRIEYFSALIIAGIILATGLSSLLESVKSIIHPKVVIYSAATIITICIAIIVKLLLGKYVFGKGQKYHSEALKNSGSDAFFDAALSAVTLISAIVTLVWDITIDGIVGATISLFIIRSGFSMLRKSVNHMLGFRADDELTRSIKKDILSFPQILGAYDLILHNYGPNHAIGSVSIEIPETMNAREIHALTHSIQNNICKEYKVFLTIGIYAVNQNNNAQSEMRKQIYNTVNTFDDVLQIHALYIDTENNSISFDTVIDFSIRNRAALREAIERAVTELYPDFTVEVSVDADFGN